MSPVNSQIVWAAGINGTYAVTTDGGAHWRSAVVPGAEQLQFRDVQGVSANVAYLLSIGNYATNFQIYKTVNGGTTWTVEFTNELPEAFYDCFAFWTPTNGVAHDDSERMEYFPIFANHERQDLAVYREPNAAAAPGRSIFLFQRNLHHNAGFEQRLDYDWRFVDLQNPLHLRRRILMERGRYSADQ